MQKHVINTAPTSEEFNEWLRVSKPNDRFIYFRGETLTYSHMSNKIRQETWHKAVIGDVYLVQRKLALGQYEFIAIKASNPPITRLVPFDERPERNRVRIQNFSSRKVRLIERVMS